MLSAIDRHLLDTDVVTLLFRGTPPTELERRVRGVPPYEKWVSVVTIAEMLDGTFQLIRLEQARSSGTAGYRLLMHFVEHFRFYNILEFGDNARPSFRNFPLRRDA